MAIRKMTNWMDMTHILTLSLAQLVTHSYINSFFKDLGIAVSTARAGNVIGGGDFAKDRIIPDCFRAAEKGMQSICGILILQDLISMYWNRWLFTY